MLVPQNDRFFKFLLILAVSYAVIAVGTFDSGLLQKRYLHQMPFWQWAILQQSPAMYNLKNAVEVKYEDGSRDVRFYNHHPMRLIYENKFEFRDQKVDRINVISINGEDSMRSSYSFSGEQNFIQLKLLN